VINPVTWPEFVACVKKQVMHIKLWQKSLSYRSSARQSADGRIILWFLHVTNSELPVLLADRDSHGLS